MNTFFSKCKDTKKKRTINPRKDIFFRHIHNTLIINIIKTPSLTQLLLLSYFPLTPPLGNSYRGKN